MTVIAWDGNTLAADGRVTAESLLITDSYDKLIDLSDVTYLGDNLIMGGISGVLADKDLLVSFLMDNKFPSLDHNIRHELSGVIVGVNYVYKLEESAWLIRYPKSTKLACGCGHKHAMSAMEFGATAVEAVKHAIKLDVCCGGKVRYWKSK